MSAQSPLDPADTRVARIVARWQAKLDGCGLELHQVDITGQCPTLGTGKVDLSLLAEDALAALDNDGTTEP